MISSVLSKQITRGISSVLRNRGYTLPKQLLLYHRPTSQEDVLKLKTGGELEANYVGDQYNQDGVSVGPVPAYHKGGAYIDGKEVDRGVWCGNEFTNIASSRWLTTPPDLGDDTYITTESDPVLQSRIDVTSGASAGLMVSVKKATNTPATHTRLTVNDGEVWAGAISKKVQLTDEWQTFFLPFVGYATGRIYYKVGAHDESGATDQDCLGGVQVKKWQIVESPYQHPYVKPGTTVPTAEGTVGGNGLSKSMVEYEDVPDGVEIITNGDFLDGTTGWTPSASAILSIVEGRLRVENIGVGYGDAKHQAILTTPGAKFNLTALWKEGTGNALVRVSHDGGGYTDYTDPLENQEIVATGEAVYISLFCNTPTVGAYSDFEFISLQKLKTVPIPENIALKNAFRGNPDGVELWVNPTTRYIDENNFSTFDPVTGIGRIVSDGTYVTLDVGEVLSVGADYRFVYEELEGSTGSVAFNQNPQYNFIYGSEVVDFTANSWPDLTIKRHTPGDVTFKLSVQKVEPSPLTLVTEVCMGVGSDELDETLRNIITVTNASAGTIQYYRGGIVGNEDSKVLIASDGATFPSIPLSPWNRYDIIQRITQVSEDGTQFRVGYKNLTQGDLSYTFSNWVAYDGSFDPLDHIRWFLNGSVPIWLRGTQIWNIQTTEQQIEGVK